MTDSPVVFPSRSPALRSAMIECYLEREAVRSIKGEMSEDYNAADLRFIRSTMDYFGWIGDAQMVQRWRQSGQGFNL